MSQRQIRSLRGAGMSMIFQEPMTALNPVMTVGDQIEEVLEVHGGRSVRARRQRVMIAAALALEPALLIADEAVSALDVSVQAQVLALLDDVRKRFDLAMLFITHDLRVAAQVCDRVAVMYKGEVVEYGKAAEVFTDPQHGYTRALFDAAPGRHWNFGTFRTD